MSDFASAAKQKNQYSQGLKWDSVGVGTLTLIVVVQRGEKNNLEISHNHFCCEVQDFVHRL